MYKKYGIDISKHNGIIDFNEVKKNNDFVIIRIGYSTTIDQMFKTNYEKAKKAGLKVGGYWYSYALNKDKAIQEAKKCYEVIKDLQFDYPIFIDMEDADQYKKKNGMPTNNELCTICEQFCEYLEERGYYVGIYASESWFNSQLKNVSSDYDRWVANWGSNNGRLQSDKSGSYHLHQFTSTYKLNDKIYDRNVSYLDYVSIMKKTGLNGYSKASNKGDTAPKKETGIKVGQKVKIKNNAIKYVTGERIPSYVKNKNYTIYQISKDKTKVLLKEIMSWIYVSDLC